MKNVSGPSIFVPCEYPCYSRPVISAFTDALCILIYMTIYSFMHSSTRSYSFCPPANLSINVFALIFNCLCSNNNSLISSTWLSDPIYLRTRPIYYPFLLPKSPSKQAGTFMNSRSYASALENMFAVIQFCLESNLRSDSNVPSQISLGCYPHFWGSLMLWKKN